MVHAAGLFSVFCTEKWKEQEKPCVISRFFIIGKEVLEKSVRIS